MFRNARIAFLTGKGRTRKGGRKKIKPTVAAGKANTALIQLSQLKEGERGVIFRINGGTRLIKRLNDLGLTPNTEVQVVKAAPFHGPIKIAVRGTHLALGRGVAAKIYLVK
ncbi:MAG: FeoA family protein [Candidatus Ranarchaeia archaeon]